MVLCSYFMNGSCRYGSKCMNDHIDLKTLLKSEVESAVNGKQWLLSCFGPFKESATIPNLVDRSFEEVRLDFLEATKNGTQQMHINELAAQYGDSLNKLNMLKMATPDTIRLVANIYNQSVQEQKKPAGNPQATNVFGASTINKPQANPFQMGNVFGGSQMNQTGMNTGSIFGSSQPVSNPFQSSQSSIFGASQEKPATTSSFSFSSGLGQQASQQSIFGSSQPSTQQTSIFGASSMSQPQQQTNSIFGSSSLTPAQPTSSIFGSAASTFGQTAAQPSIFGSSAPSSSIFGSSATPSSTFGSVAAPSTFGQPAAPASTFGQGAATGGFGSTTASSFGMASSNVFGSTPSTFGSIQNQNPTSTFGGGSIFAPSTVAPTQTPSTPFGASVFQQQQSAGAGIFGSPPQLTPQSSFGQPSTNVFGGFQSQIEPAPQQQQPSNIFSAAPASQPPQNIFGAQQTATATAPVSTGSIFQIQQQAPSSFGANPFQTQPIAINDSVYSKVEDLTPEELQAFQADTFEIGKIPSKPPPKHLCV